MDNQTLELCEKIEEVNITIDEFVTAIAVNDSETKDGLYQQFLVQIQEVFTMIIQYYTRPDMEELQHELQEWSGQLGRIMDAIKGKDLFFLIDVLKFETKENLLYLYDVIVKRA